MQEGSEAAMEALVHRYHRQIFTYHCRLSGHRQTAEDLTQETFVRIISRIGSYQFPQPFSPWAYTIAHNLFRDHRKEAEQRAIPAEEPVRAGSRSILDLSEHIAQQAEVSSALRRLDDDHREAVILRFYHDLKVDEIARATGVPPGTVKSRLHTAVRKLKDLILSEGSGRRDAKPGRSHP